MKINTTCRLCNVTYPLHVCREDYLAWRDGAFIQNVMPYLNEAARELLISGTCDKCFNELFAEVRG